MSDEIDLDHIPVINESQLELLTSDQLRHIMSAWRLQRENAQKRINRCNENLRKLNDYMLKTVFKKDD